MIKRGICLLMAVLAACLFLGPAQGESVAIPGGGGMGQNEYTRDEVLQFMHSTASPNFSLPSLDGKTVSLSDFRGQIVLLTFWVSWDPACLDSLGLLNQVSGKYKDVAVLAINSLPTESNQASWTAEAKEDHIAWVRGYLAENGYRFRALLDEDGSVGNMHAYRSSGLPMTFFIDREGILRIPWQGRLSEQTVDTLLAMMFALDP